MTGRFIWHDFLAKDTDAAIDFYTGVIGWRTEDFQRGASPDPYRVWVGNQGPLGGVMALPKEARTFGVPPHWVGYVEVDDIEATVARVREKGGAVHVPPTEIPDVGRFGVIADPQGATLSVLQPASEETSIPPHDRSSHGAVSWNELHASDARSAFEFYGDLFGWTLKEEIDMGPDGAYLAYGQGEETYGGIMTKDADSGAGPMWVYYIHVDDLEAVLAHATSEGAKVELGPLEVPDGSRIAYLMDPQGARFALHGPPASASA